MQHILEQLHLRFCIKRSILLGIIIGNQELYRGHLQYLQPPQHFQHFYHWLSLHKAPTQLG